MAETIFLKVLNRVTTITAGEIDDSTDPVVFSVAPGAGAIFPDENFIITIDDERMLCTSRTVDALTCTRAQDNSAIAAHPAASVIALNVVAAIIDELQTAVNALEAVDPLTDIILKAYATEPAFIKGKLYRDTVTGRMYYGKDTGT